MRFDTRSLPARLSDEFQTFRNDWNGLGDDARTEVRNTRIASLRGRRSWGCVTEGSYAVRIDSGEVLTGDEVTEMNVTETLYRLADSLKKKGETVWGYGSVFDVGYVLYDMFGPYVEVMNRHAFEKSLELEALQVSFLSSHTGLGMGTTRGGSMAVDADTHGLAFAVGLNMSESDSRNVYRKLESKSTPTDTSIAGVIKAYEWNDSYDEVEIYNWWMSRGEISIVQAGANPAGWIATKKATADADRDIDRELRELQTLSEVQQMRVT